MLRTALRWGRRYLMCPPGHFDISYSINPWMHVEVPVDRERAARQWDALRAALEEAGAEVEVLDPRPGLPDMVFTANAGLVTGDELVPVVMRPPQRRGERPHAERWFARHGFRVAPLPGDGFQEGAGDALPFGDVLVAGYRTRSSLEAWDELSARLSVPVVPVELPDPRYYHLDLTFCPLDDRRALVAPSAWTADGWRRVRELVPEPIVLGPDELAAFCANSVVVGATVVMPACPPRLRTVLEEAGFRVVVVDVSEFVKAGGAVRCLTLALDVRLGAKEDPAALVERHSAHNYDPLPVVIAGGEGAWVHDDHGRSYLDCLAGYSALNFGHRHPDLVAAARRQLDRLTLTSRAFHNDQLGPFCRELAELCGKERVLPMNTGAEAVETAIKAARKWGYEVKGVAPDRARIVVCQGNFHGRTTTIVSFSDDPLARDGFGPFTPGFVSVPFGDAAALEEALRDDDVVAFLVEPIQGEAGVIVPPDGYLREARRLCHERGVLLVADEIQSGLGRTGRTFACEHEGVEPDLYVLGKALGGGVVPVSAVVGDDEVLGLFRPGEHGSTFGGNPLACAVGREVIRLLRTGVHQRRAAELGATLLSRLRAADLPSVAEVRGRGLWAGVELRRDGPSARRVCEELMREGILVKDAHETTIRLMPPLVITEAELDWALERLEHVLAGVPLPVAA